MVKRRSLVLAAVIGLGSLSFAHGQEKPAQLTFDVATIKPEQRVFLLLNAKHSNNRLGKTAKDGALSMFSDQGIEISILETEIHDRTAFAEAPASGQTVIEFSPASKAAEEILSLTKEVINLCLVAQP